MSAASYEFNQPIIEVGIRLPENIVVEHRLRRPTIDELRQREQKIESVAEEVSDTEIATTYRDEEATAQLWDKLVMEVRGYRIAVGDTRTSPKEWIPISEEIRQGIPLEHKRAAFTAVYSGRAHLVDPDADLPPEERGFAILGMVEVTVGLELHGADVTFVFRQPTEKEWLSYRVHAQQTREVRGARRKKIRVVSNLDAGVKLFDATLLRITGATADGSEWSEALRERFLSLVDPLYKRLVVSVMAERFGAELLD